MQKLLDGALIIILATGFALNVKAARAERLTVTFGVPTVAGIRPAPVPGEFYDARMPIVSQRPRAAILGVPGGIAAPPNGCDRPAFEVISGPKAERGCYGAQ
jgi:hypothetical protein